MTKAKATMDERIDAALGELAEAIDSVRDMHLNAPIVAQQRELLARLSVLEALAANIHRTRQVAAQVRRQVQQWEAAQQETQAMIADLERQLVALPERPDPSAASRTGQERQALEDGLAFAREGTTPTGAVPGAVVAYARARGLADIPSSRPTVDALLERARADLEPVEQRLASALESWDREREPAPAA